MRAALRSGPSTGSEAAGVHTSKDGPSRSKRSSRESDSSSKEEDEDEDESRAVAMTEMSARARSTSEVSLMLSKKNEIRVTRKYNQSQTDEIGQDEICICENQT